MIVKRLVHTSGDPSLVQAVRIHARAIADGLAALQRGASIVSDVHMVRMGMNSGRLAALGTACCCLIDDPEVAAMAAAHGHTRAQTAMRLFGKELDGAIVAIGNAPTALREVLALAREGIARPALVIGTPVGFVDAAESKDALMARPGVYRHRRHARRQPAGGSHGECAVAHPGGASGMTALRSGYTTGTCAAAAAKRRSRLRGETCWAVEIVLPDGAAVILPVERDRTMLSDTWRGHVVVKDAGDDPDITHGMTVAATIEVAPETDITFSSG